MRRGGDNLTISQAAIATAVGRAVTNEPEAGNVVAVAACAPRLAKGQTIMLPGAQVLSGTSTHEEPSAYMMVQKEPVVVVVEGGGVVELVSMLAVVVVAGVVGPEASRLVVESIVIVVIDVSDSAGEEGQERSGRSSCRFTLEAGTPQPARALPGCLFPVEEGLGFEEWTDGWNGMEWDAYKPPRSIPPAEACTGGCQGLDCCYAGLSHLGRRTASSPLRPSHPASSSRALAVRRSRLPFLPPRARRQTSRSLF